MKSSDLAFDLYQSYITACHGRGATLLARDAATKRVWQSVAEVAIDLLSTESKAEVASLNERILALEAELRSAKGESQLEQWAIAHDADAACATVGGNLCYPSKYIAHGWKKQVLDLRPESTIGIYRVLITARLDDGPFDLSVYQFLPRVEPKL